MVTPMVLIDTIGDLYQPHQKDTLLWINIDPKKLKPHTINMNVYFMYSFFGLSHVGIFGQFISSVTVKKYGTPICIEEDPSQLHYWE